MKALAALALLLGLLFVGCLLGATMGAIAGFVVGLAFDGSLALLAKALGIPGAEPYQLGAICGFISGFFQSSVCSSKE